MVDGFSEEIFREKPEFSTRYPHFPPTYPHAFSSYPPVVGNVENLSTRNVENLLCLSVLSFSSLENEDLVIFYGSIHKKFSRLAVFLPKNPINLSV